MATDRSTLAVIEPTDPKPGFRRMPASEQVERAVLGAILVNNIALERVSEILRPEHFYFPAHGRIYSACQAMHAMGRVADPLTLQSYFERDDDLSEVGGAQYLIHLAADVTGVIDVEDYARTLHDHALRRDLITLGEDIVNTAYTYDVENPATQQIQDAEDQLYKIADQEDTSGGFRDFDSVAQEAITMASAALNRESRLTGVTTGLTDMDKLLGGVPKVVDALRPEGWEDAAKAIMTTDTVHKVRTRAVTIGGQTVRMTGIVKGAGMIHPNMATMLSVVVTDAYIAQPLLQQALSTAADLSYNRISIDGDTSTNDTVLLLANGMAGHAEIVDASSAEFGAFQAALNDLCTELAQALVRDGEGATKFIQIQVNGGVSKADAHLAANTLAISPLCKTAFYGSDANWGRFVMALGRSGANVKPDQCSIYITGGIDNSQRLPELQLLAGGMPTGYAEADAAERFAQKEIDVRIELGLGDGSATVWTSDLSHEYVSINADYRT